MTAHEKAQQKKRAFENRIGKAKAAIDGFRQVVKSVANQWEDTKEALELSADDYPKTIVAIKERQTEIEKLIKEETQLQSYFEDLAKQNTKEHCNETDEFIFKANRKSDRLTAAINSLHSLTKSLIEQRKQAAIQKENKEKALDELIEKFSRSCLAASAFSQEARENVNKKIGSQKSRTLVTKRLDELNELTSALPEVKEKKVPKSRIELLLQRVNQQIELLKMANEELLVRKECDEQSLFYCLVCGHGAPASSHCPACGAKHPLKMVCKRCHSMWKHPVHLIAKEHKETTIHCVNCGKSLSKSVRASS